PPDPCRIHLRAVFHALPVRAAEPRFSDAMRRFNVMPNTHFRAAETVFRSTAAIAAVALLSAAPTAGAQSTSPRAAAMASAPSGCDRDCLIGLADRYMAALVDKDFSGLPWAERVRFTENDVGLMMGDGVWGTVTKIDDDPFKLADPATGNVLWVGTVEEHGQPAYYAMRLAVEDGRIAEV